MKTPASLLALVLVLIAGCSNATTIGPVPDTNDGSQVWRGLSAKINSSAWVADNATASNRSGQTTISASGAGESIGISFATVSAPGTMTFNTRVVGNYSSGVNSYSTDGNANAGTLTITEVDATHIAGRFSFTAAETQTLDLVKVTSGTFNILF